MAEPQERRGAEHEPGGERRDRPPVVAPPCHDLVPAEPGQEHQLGGEREEAERMRRHQEQRGQGVRHGPPEPPRPQEHEHQPQAPVRAGDHRRVAARELGEVDGDGGDSGDDGHRRPARPAHELAPAAVRQTDGEDAEEGRRKPQAKDVVPPVERGVHDQVVERRPVPVLDRHVQHVAHARLARDVQRHDLVVVQGPEVEPEPDDENGVAHDSDSAQERGPSFGHKSPHLGAREHRRGIIGQRGPSRATGTLARWSPTPT